MYFLPLKVITDNPGDLDAETRLAAYEMLMHELNRTHLGQGMDITWHNEREVDITEAEYLEMCACKTGCLGRIVARLAAIVTGQPDTVEDAVAGYAERMSVAFQIGDDILDVEHSLDRAGEFGKAFGNDIREGKKTLVAINAVERAAPEDAARLEEVLWADENTDEEIEWVLDLYQSTGSIEYARETAQSLSEQARAHLDGLTLASESKERLSEFTRFVVERDV
jgi:geranylgeranyl diphosphate synthase type I